MSDDQRNDLAEMIWINLVSLWYEQKGMKVSSVTFEDGKQVNVK